MQTDYIIIGQGICGTLLSYSLLQKGMQVMVIDDAAPHTSSRVASGLINPVTGKRVVQSWMIQPLMAAAQEMYGELESELDISILQQSSLLDFHATAEEKAIFQSRAAENEEFLQLYPDQYQEEYFRFHQGIGQVEPCWLVDLPALLGHWRQRLAQHNALLETKYDVSQLQVLPDHVEYQDISARGIIYCGGVTDFKDPLFQALPWSQNKGEVLIASIPGLPRNHIYKHGIKIVPFKDDLFWIGASFEWTYENTEPTTAFRSKAEQQLAHWLKLPYTIVDHWAAERPSTVDYKPFVGSHPLHNNVFMLNGMGTKGCSQAPYFARQLTNYILRGTGILPEASLHRYQRILSR